MSEFDRKATIKELDRISELYNLRNDLKERISEMNGEAEDEKWRLRTTVFNKKELKSYQEAINRNFGADMPKLSPIAYNMPPCKPCVDNEQLRRAAICGLICLICIAAEIILMITAILLNNTNIFMDPGVIISIVLTFSFVGYCKWYSEIQEYTKWKKECANRKRQLKTIGKFNNNRFFVECDNFEKTLKKNIAICTAYYDEKMQAFESDRKTIVEKWTEKILPVKAELDNVECQLATVTLIHSKFFHSAALISELLSTQRADTLKEAINLAIEEERKDAQETERRYEALRQEIILEKQASQTRMHEQEMERSVREHATQMQTLARAQTEETERLRLAVERQNKDNRRDVIK